MPRASKRSKATVGFRFHISSLRDNHSAGFCVPTNTVSRFAKLIRSTFATQKAFLPPEMVLSLVPTQTCGSLRMRKQTLHTAAKFTSEAMMQVLTKSLPHHAEEVSQSPSLPPCPQVKPTNAGGKSCPSKLNSFSASGAETTRRGLSQTSKSDSNKLTIS